MAVINRFYNPRQTNRINPIGFEELAFVPQQMRQLHDQAEVTAAENAVNQTDALPQDAQLSSELYAPIEKQFLDTISKLSKNGFTHEIKSEVNALIGKKKILERDKISKIEARTASYRENVALIKEQFKNDPESMNNRLNALNLANQAPSTMVDGQLNVPAIQDVFRANIMTTTEKQKIANDTMSDLKEKIISLGIQYDGTLKGFTNAFSSTTIGGIGKERIMNLLRTNLSRDMFNSFKMEGLLNGIGGENDPIIRERFANEIPNTVSDAYLVNWLSEHKDATSEEIIKAREVYEASDKFADTVAQQQDSFSRTSTEDYYAQYAIDNFVTGVANSMAYSQIKSKHYLRTDAKLLAEHNARLKPKDGTEFSFNALPFDTTGYVKPAFDSSKMEVSEDGTRFIMAGNDAPETVTGIMHGSILARAEYTYVDADGNEVLAKDALGRATYATKNSPMPTYALKEGIVAHRKDIKEVADAETEYTKLVDSVPYFRNMSRQAVLNKLKTLEAKNATIINTVHVPSDMGTIFRREYLGDKTGNNIQTPINDTSSTYSLNAGKADVSFNGLAEQLGYGSIEEFMEEGNFSGGKYSPEIGQFQATAIHGKTGKSVNVYIQPDTKLADINAMLVKAIKAQLSLAPKTLISQDADGYFYQYNDFRGEQSYMVETPEKMNTYEDLENFVHSQSAADGTVTTMKQYATVQSIEIVNDDAYLKYIK